MGGGGGGGRDQGDDRMPRNNNRVTHFCIVNNSLQFCTLSIHFVQGIHTHHKLPALFSIVCL